MAGRWQPWRDTRGTLCCVYFCIGLTECTARLFSGSKLQKPFGVLVGGFLLLLFRNTAPAPPPHAPQAQHYTPRAVRAQLPRQTSAQPGRCPASPAALIYHMQHIANPCPAQSCSPGGEHSPQRGGSSSCSPSAASPVPGPREVPAGGA